MHQTKIKMEVVGKIKKIFDEQSFSSGFRKKEIVITTEEQYPQDLLIEFTQDRIEILNAYNIGDKIKVSINLRGREWINPEGVAKYFNSIQGWRIERAGDAADTFAESQPLPPLETYKSEQEQESESDDLPF